MTEKIPSPSEELPPEVLPHKSEHVQESGRLRMAVAGVKQWVDQKRGRLPVSSHIPGGYEAATQTSLAERHPDWPHINASFFFSAHSTAQDMEDLESRIKQADIYLYEYLGGEDYEDGASHVTRGLQMLNASQNAILPAEHILSGIAFKDKPVHGSAMEPVVRGIHGSKVIVGSIDQSKAENEKMFAIEAVPFRFSGTLEQPVEEYAEELKEVASSQAGREQVMVGRFENEIARILKQHPELKKKESLKVLLSLGALHTGVEHEFRKIGITTDHTFTSQQGSENYMYDYRHQAMRAYRFGKTPNHKVLENAWFEEVLERATRLQPDFGSIADTDIYTNDIAVYTRQTVDVLDDDAKQLMFYAIKYKPDNVPHIIQMFNSALKRAGRQELPRTASEFAQRLTRN